MSYSNVAFSLLGIVIERAGNTTYAEYITGHILDKIGMSATSAVFDDPRSVNSMSKGYMGAIRVSSPYIRDNPAGSMVSSADDLAKMLRHLLLIRSETNNGILKKSTLDTMWMRQNGAVARDLDQSIGITFWQGSFSGLPAGGKQVRTRQPPCR